MARYVLTARLGAAGYVLTAWSELSMTDWLGQERPERWGRVRFVVTVRSGTSLTAWPGAAGDVADGVGGTGLSLPGRRGADGFVADGLARHVVDGVVRRGVAWHVATGWIGQEWQVADGQARQGMSGTVGAGSSLTGAARSGMERPDGSVWLGQSKTERCGMDS